MTKTLWAPWRMEFIAGAHGKKQRGCVFCRLLKKGVSAESLVVFRGNSGFVLLNRYPYTNGHLLVIPLRHFNKLEEATKSEINELGRLLSRSVSVLKKAIHPQGFNIGMNIGRSAGAGIEGHLHYHVVPRWTGDSNFMPVVGNTKVMPEYIERTYKRLKSFF